MGDTIRGVDLQSVSLSSPASSDVGKLRFRSAAPTAPVKRQRFLLQ
jgi:hypothetical protein